MYDPLYALGRFSLPEKQAFWSNPLDTATDLLADEITKRPEPPSIQTSQTHKRFTVSIRGQLQAGCFLALPLQNRSQSLGFLLLGWQADGHCVPPGDRTDSTLICVNRRGEGGTQAIDFVIIPCIS